MWGGASDEQGVAYLGISDFTAGKPEVGGGLIAFQLKTGETLWKTPAPKPACLATPGCSAAQPGPVTVIPGVAFLGSSDGHIRAYETNKGAIIWDFDTAKDFQTVNGVKAHGGSIISMGPVIAERDALHGVRLHGKWDAGQCAPGILPIAHFHAEYTCLLTRCAGFAPGRGRNFWTRPLSTSAV